MLSLSDSRGGEFGTRNEAGGVVVALEPDEAFDAWRLCRGLCCGLCTGEVNGCMLN